MADFQPIFESVMYGTGTLNAEVWVDLGVIPSGKSYLLGFATYIAESKTCQFETRSSLAGKSAATIADTQLHDWTSAQAGTSVDRDFYQNGLIATETVVSSGVEHLWLRIRAQSSSSGTYNYIIYYTVQ
jgi:hypothetical protein